LSTRPNGGGGSVPSGFIFTRRGPSAPRCSQTDDEPGPPLKQNVTGRVAELFSLTWWGETPSSRVIYPRVGDVKNEARVVPSFLRIGNMPVSAIYFTRWPAMVTVFVVKTGLCVASGNHRGVIFRGGRVGWRANWLAQHQPRECCGDGHQQNPDRFFHLNLWVGDTRHLTRMIICLFTRAYEKFVPGGSRLWKC